MNCFSIWTAGSGSFVSLLDAGPSCSYNAAEWRKSRKIRSSVSVFPKHPCSQRRFYQFRSSISSGCTDNSQAVSIDEANEDELLEGPRIDVRALARNLHHAKTADEVDTVLRNHPIFHPRVYSSVIKGLGWDQKLECAIAIVDWLKRKKDEGADVSPNIFIYNSLLGAVKQSQHLHLTEKILSDMSLDGVSPNAVTYNTLMAIYVERGETINALNLIPKMSDEGIHPSAATYSTALQAYRKMEDANEVVKFFLGLREKYDNNTINTGNDDDWGKEFPKLEKFTIRVCHQVMRRWLVKKEDLSTAVLKLFADMDEARLSSSRSDYERLIWACTRAEHHNVARELYDRIRGIPGEEISLSVCNHVIWVMGKAKKWWAALETYEDLLDKGPQPNNLSYELIVSHFNVLLTAAKRKGSWRWGMRLLNKMEQKGLKPGAREWNSVLVACSKAAETTAAIEIFRRMIDNGERPTIVSYGALLSALEKGKLHDEAIRVWDHMGKVGVLPNVYAYTTMGSLLASKGDFDGIEELIREMVGADVGPTVVTYNAIISAAGRNGYCGKAYDWYGKMREGGIAPNEITYEMLIECVAREGKPRLAHDLFLSARTQGLFLSFKAYDSVIQCCRLNDVPIDVTSLGPRPEEPTKVRELHGQHTMSMPITF